MKDSYTITGKVESVGIWGVEIEFGRTQMGVEFSENGKIQRALKLKEGDLVDVIVKVRKRV